MVCRATLWVSTPRTLDLEAAPEGLDVITENAAPEGLDVITKIAAPEGLDVITGNAALEGLHLISEFAAPEGLHVTTETAAPEGLGGSAALDKKAVEAGVDVMVRSAVEAVKTQVRGDTKILKASGGTAHGSDVTACSGVRVVRELPGGPIPRL